MLLCPIIDFLFVRLPLTQLCVFSSLLDSDMHRENSHKAYLPICSVADFENAPLPSHLSRVYPNMKINSLLNAAICSQRQRGKSNTGLH